MAAETQWGPEDRSRLEVPQSETMALATSLLNSLLDRADSVGEFPRPERLRLDIWKLLRVELPPNQAARMFAVDRSDIVRSAEISYITDESSEVPVSHIAIEINSTTTIDSGACEKLELWELYETEDMFSALWVEYSRDGQRIPMRTPDESDTNPLVAFSRELMASCHNLSYRDVAQIEQLRNWLRS